MPYALFTQSELKWDSHSGLTHMNVLLSLFSQLTSCSVGKLFPILGVFFLEFSWSEIKWCIPLSATLRSFRIQIVPD